MRVLLLLVSSTVLMGTSLSFAQATTGSAVAKGTCNQSVSGNNNRNFVIKCGIGEAQGKQMLDILNKILANQQKLQPDVVMQKLDAILKDINPNLPVKTYFCSGQWKTAGPSATAGFAISMGGDDVIFQAMARLNNTGQYKELLDRCSAQIALTPEWLTPRLFCGIAYTALGDKVKAREMLSEYEARVGPAYDVPACKQMSDYLQAHTK